MEAPGLGRPLGERSGNPLQYPCLSSQEYGQRSLVGYMHGFAKELDMTMSKQETNAETFIYYKDSFIGNDWLSLHLQFTILMI